MTGSTLTTSVAFHTVIAGQRLLAYQRKLLPVICKRPGFRFIEPHQRRLKTHLARHAKRFIELKQEEAMRRRETNARP